MVALPRLIRLNGQLVDLGALTSAPVKPGVSNTGVPVGLLGDTRPAEALALPTLSSGSYGAGTARVNLQSDTTYDHIDFSDVQVVIQAGKQNITLNRCKFKIHTPSRLFRLIEFQSTSASPIVGVTLNECTLDGSTDDARFPIGALSFPSGALASPAAVMPTQNVALTKCNIFGATDGFITQNIDGATLTGCYIHDLTPDKSGDAASGYTDPTKWSHVDVIQIGAGSAAKNVLVSGCVLDGPADGEVVQIGGMVAYTDASAPLLQNFSVESGWADWGGWMFDADITPQPIVVGYCRSINNRIGLNSKFGLRATGLWTVIETAWTDNVWDVSGLSLRGAGPAVVAGTPAA